MSAGQRPADTDAVAHVIVDELADDLILGGDEGHHLVRVRRLRAGELVTAADGLGTWRQYSVITTERNALHLGNAGEPVSEPVSVPTLTLAFAPAKGDRPELVVRAATELGVDAIVPVITERSVVRWKNSDVALDRLARVVREAAGQSRRARLPILHPVCALAGVASAAGLVVADRGGTAPGDLLVPPGGEWTVLVGPEGGFTPTEQETLGRAPRVALGAHVLRAETAAIAAVVVLSVRHAS